MWPGGSAGVARPRAGPPPSSPRATEHGDEHVIKLTEVLLAGHALPPDRAYLAAAQAPLARR